MGRFDRGRLLLIYIGVVEDEYKDSVCKPRFLQLTADRLDAPRSPSSPSAILYISTTSLHYHLHYSPLHLLPPLHHSTSPLPPLLLLLPV